MILNNKKQSLYLLFLLLSSFFLPPLLILFFIIFESIIKNKFLVTRVLLSSYLGFINTNKLLESDLLGYNISYENSSLSNILSIGKEPLYFFSEFIFSNLNLPFSGFLFFVTFSSYMLLYKASLNFCKKHKLLDSLFLILFITFFSNIFTLSAHLIRQFIAMSIIIYAISLENRKTSIFLTFLSFLIHSSALLFIPIFFKSLDKKLTFKVLVYFFLGVFLLIQFINFVLTLLADIPFFNYFYNRSTSGIDAFTTSESMGSFSFIFLFLLISLNILNSLKHHRERNNFLFFNIISLFSIFIFVISFFNDLIAYRYLQYLIVYFPFVFFLFLSRFKNVQILFILKFGIIVFLCFYFFYKIENGVWNYGPVEYLIYGPVEYLINL